MKIWWFKRLKDNKYIDFASESTAGRLFHDRNFDRKFQYIGWSDGTEFNKVMAGHAINYDPMSTNEELAAHQNKPEVKKKRRELVKQARIAEMTAAKNNPDKTRPVYDPVFVSSSNKARGNKEIRQMLKGKGI